jgi:hypothetical protein
MKNFIILLLLLMNSIQCMELEVAVDEMPQVTAQIGDPSVFLPSTRIYYNPNNHSLKYITVDNSGQEIAYQAFEQSIKALVERGHKSTYISVDKSANASMYKTPPSNSSTAFTLFLIPTLTSIKNQYSNYMQMAIDIAVNNSLKRNPEDAILLQAYWNICKKSLDHSKYDIELSTKFIGPCNKFLRNDPITEKQKDNDPKIIHFLNSLYFQHLLKKTKAEETGSNILNKIHLTKEHAWQFEGRKAGWAYTDYVFNLFLNKMRQDKAATNIRDQILDTLYNLETQSLVPDKDAFSTLITTVFEEKKIEGNNIYEEPEVINTANLKLLKDALETKNFAPLKLNRQSSPPLWRRFYIPQLTAIALIGSIVFVIKRSFQSGWVQRLFQKMRGAGR